MGQYWIPVNLDKREFIHPHKLAAGLKLWEQLANHPGTAAALVLLLAAQPEQRGGGDLEPRPIVGRWAGDRVALVGDYAERSDLALEHEADLVYYLCRDRDEIEATADHWIHADWTENPANRGREVKAMYAERANRLLAAEPYRDVSAEVCEALAAELGGQYVGDGWRSFERVGGHG